MAFSILTGAAAGLALGLLSRLALIIALSKPAKTFYAVWVAGIVLRLAATLWVFVALYKSGWPHPAASALAMILAQTAALIIPPGRAAQRRLEHGT